MSRLSVYWPDECGPTSVDENPDILPFPTRRDVDVPALDVVSRARLMFENRRCRHCGYPVVEPLERDDALVNRNGQEIPGTATLVGFQCLGCHSSWIL